MQALTVKANKCVRMIVLVIWGRRSRHQCGRHPIESRHQCGRQPIDVARPPDDQSCPDMHQFQLIEVTCIKYDFIEIFMTKSLILIAVSVQ